jgi:hypothetical protein
MLKKLRRTLFNLSFLGMLMVPFAAPVAVSAASDDIGGGLKCGANLDISNIDNPNCDADTGDPGGKLNDIIATVINVFSIVVGIIAVIMIIIGGLKYITSSGDSGNVTGAKNTILYAVVGLIVVALAQFVVKFVLDKTVDGTTTGS